MNPARLSRFRRPIVLVAAATMLSLTLSGCSILEGVVKTASDAASQSSFTLTGLPDSWPAEVPVISGTVSGAAQVTDGWTALVKSSSQTALTDARDALVSAGFAERSNLSGNGSGVITLENSHYRVTLTGSTDGVLYVIAPAT